MIRRTLLLVLAGTLGCAGDASGSAPTPTAADIPYDTKHDRNALDFWRADSDRPTPVFVWFHGGGFTGGDKSRFPRQHAPLLNALLAKGISVASCNYPFRKDAGYEEIMRHGARAVQFLRSKTGDWNVDPERIGACGSSAGALIAGWVGYHPDLARPDAPDPVDRLSSSLAAVGSHLQPTGTELLVMPHMKAGGPPLFLWSIAPESEQVHNPEYARMMKRLADQKEIPCEMWGHGNALPEVPPGETWQTLQLKFFCKHLGVE